MSLLDQPWLRLKACFSKKSYPERGDALSVARQQKAKGVDVWVYACFICMGYHLTRNSSPRRAWRLPPGYGDSELWELGRDKVGTDRTATGLSFVERLARARWLLLQPKRSTDEQQ